MKPARTSGWIEDPLEVRGFFRSLHPPKILPRVGELYLKLKSRIWNEIAAHQLARYLSLPVPKADYFSLREITKINEEEYGVGHPGMLLEPCLTTTEFPSVVAASCEARLKVQILAFSFFCGGPEWPEIWGTTDRSVVLLDLEQQFARFYGDHKKDEGSLVRYEEGSASMIKACRKDAMEAGINAEFHEGMHSMITSIRGGFSYDFSGCEDSCSIEGFFNRSLKIRMDAWGRAAVESRDILRA